MFTEGRTTDGRTDEHDDSNSLQLKCWLRAKNRSFWEFLPFFCRECQKAHLHTETYYLNPLPSLYDLPFKCSGPYKRKFEKPVFCLDISANFNQLPVAQFCLKCQKEHLYRNTFPLSPRPNLYDLPFKCSGPYKLKFEKSLFFYISAIFGHLPVAEFGRKCQKAHHFTVHISSKLCMRSVFVYWSSNYLCIF